jgi:glycine cleavage system aminomethyltransferase T
MINVIENEKQHVIASEAKQSRKNTGHKSGLLRRCAPRNDEQNIPQGQNVYRKNGSVHVARVADGVVSHSVRNASLGRNFTTTKGYVRSSGGFSSHLRQPARDA